MINDASVVIGGGNWGIKEADVLGYKLINDEYYARDIDFANSTAAGTYTDSTGVIRKAPYNLLQYSEQFDNAAWSKSASTIGIDATVAPNGTLTADKLQEDSSNSNHLINQSVANTNSLFSFSIYAKKSERDFIYIQAFGVIPNNFTYVPNAYFNLNTGVVSSVSGGTATIQDAGNGWYRCILNCTSIFAQTSASVGFYIMPATANGVNSYVGTTGSGIFIWGAQLVEGTEALPYFPTTTRLNVPRIDYRNADGSLSTTGRLLIEPQRTNRILYSEQFDNAAWVKSVATVTANTTISPDGSQNADTIAFTASAIAFCQQIVAGAFESQSHTVSVYAKVASGTATFRLKCTHGGVLDYFSSDFTATTEWQRFTFTATFGATIGTSIVCGVINATNALAKNVIFYGFQTEANASYATTYIPTTTASVTRNADVASKTGVSSWIGQTQGTLFIDFDYNQPTSDSNGRLLQVYGTSDTTNSILPLIYGFGSDVNEFQLTVFSASIASIPIPASVSTVVPFGRQKFAIAYNAGVYTVYRNGSLFASGSGLAPVSLTAMELGSTTFFARSLGNPINQAALFPTRLTNEQLSQLTTL